MEVYVVECYYSDGYNESRHHVVGIFSTSARAVDACRKVLGTCPDWAQYGVSDEDLTITPTVLDRIL